MSGQSLVLIISVSYLSALFCKETVVSVLLLKARGGDPALPVCFVLPSGRSPGDVHLLKDTMDQSIRTKIWLIMLVGVILPRAGWGNEPVPAGYRSIATEQGVPHTVLYAVALTESGKQIESTGGYRPWPWTLNLAGQGYFYHSRSAAWQALTGWLREGKRSIDIGLMHGQLAISPEKAWYYRGRRSIRITTCVWARPSCKSATRPDRIGGPAWVVITRRRTQIGQIATVNG